MGGASNWEWPPCGRGHSVGGAVVWEELLSRKSFYLQLNIKPDFFFFWGSLQQKIL